MLEPIELPDDKVVGLRIDGRIDDDTFDELLSRIEDRLGRHEKIRLYVELVSLGGVGLDTLFKDLKFGLGNWRRFEREAVVSDKQWVQKIGPIADKLFPTVEVKVFPMEEREQAWEWVRA